MGEVATIGLDIAKSVFQVHGVDVDGVVVIQRRLTRAPIEEEHVERVLELAHVVGQRRGHLAEQARGRREAAAARDCILRRTRAGDVSAENGFGRGR